MRLKRISERGWLGEEGEAEGVSGVLGVSECEEGGRGLSKELLPVLESRSHQSNHQLHAPSATDVSTPEKGENLEIFGKTCGSGCEQQQLLLVCSGLRSAARHHLAN